MAYELWVIERPPKHARGASNKYVTRLWTSDDLPEIARRLLSYMKKYPHPGIDFALQEPNDSPLAFGNCAEDGGTVYWRTTRPGYKPSVGGLKPMTLQQFRAFIGTLEEKQADLNQQLGYEQPTELPEETGQRISNAGRDYLIIKYYGIGELIQERKRRAIRRLYHKKRGDDKI
jgi:hypothetical protein